MTESQIKEVISAISIKIKTTALPTITISSILGHPSLQFKIILQEESKLIELFLNHEFQMVNVANLAPYKTGSIIKIGPNAYARYHLQAEPKKEAPFD